MGTSLPALAFRCRNGRHVRWPVAAARDHESVPQISLVLQADDVTESGTRGHAKGPWHTPSQYRNPAGPPSPRHCLTHRTWRRSREKVQNDATHQQSLSATSLTRVNDRSILLSHFFRETNRAQRMKTTLSLPLLAVEAFAHWSARLDTAVSKDLLCAVAERTARLFRSYNLLWSAGAHEFVVILPGCTVANAMMLTERLRIDGFGAPISLGQESIRLSACFGIASSKGRSPMVIGREAESAIQRARDAGPDAIECFANRFAENPDPAAFLS